MGKPLSRPGCFRKNSCCLEKSGAGDGGVGVHVRGVDGTYGDGYVPQRSIYDTMCINQQIDSHHHHPAGFIRQDFVGDGSFSYSSNDSLRVSRDMSDPQPRSLTPNPSFVRRLDERVIYDSLKLGGQGADGDGCHSPGCFTRPVSPSVSSLSAPGGASSSKKHHHYHHHCHGGSRKSTDGRHTWKVLTPPKHLKSLELTTTEMMDRGVGYVNPGHYPPPGGQSFTVISPLISPFSGSPLSSGYHTPIFVSPAKPRPSQTQSLRCSPPQVMQPRHYSQTQSLRLSPPHDLRRSPYRAQLVQLSAHDLEQDLKDRGGCGRNEREREWEREREREMERGWAQREWERERERGRLERESTREKERKETSTFGTFGYGQPVPLRSNRDSVFLESDQLLDTTPLLLPQPSPSPCPSSAPRMGTCVVGRNRAALKVVPESISGCMMSKVDNGSLDLVFVQSKSGCGPRMVNAIGAGNMSEAEIRAGIEENHGAASWNKYNNGSRESIKNCSEKRMSSQVKTRPGGRDLEGRVQSGVENMAPAVNKDGHRDRIRSRGKTERVVSKPECNAEAIHTTLADFENKVVHGDKVEIESGCYQGMKSEIDTGVEAEDGSRQIENRTGTEAGVEAIINIDVNSAAESSEEARVEKEMKTTPVPEPERGMESGIRNESGTKGETEIDGVGESNNNNKTTDKAEISAVVGDKTDTVPADQTEKKILDIDRIEYSYLKEASKTHKSKSLKSSSRTRPGTATGIHPGAVCPQLKRGLGDLESTGPIEDIEYTWPRRIMIRKRTVRQGGALHNLPILPPLPSVLSALEKRCPHALLHSHPANLLENPLTNFTNARSIMGRCSLKEPSYPETGQGSSVVGRGSLKEYNLEHWIIWKEQEEQRQSSTKEKQQEQNKEKTEREERKWKEMSEREMRGEKDRGEKEGVTVIQGLVQESKQGKSEKMPGEEMPVDGNKKKGLKTEQDVEIKRENKDKRGQKMKDGMQEQHGQELDELVVKLETEEGEDEGGEGWTFAEEGGMQSWNAVLEMVTTLWDDGWEKGEAEAGGETDSLSGSQRWPLLQPPVGFGGSHPTSSATSELSLTEIERRAKELDSELEHLDLSQPHKDTETLYPTLLEPQSGQGVMYQTHPGLQREKVTLLTGVGSRSQISLELSAVASPALDTDRPSGDWSAKSPGISTAGKSSNKEDSSPDSNLTLESDSSGVFLSLSNQSQEEAGSDSDQPISGSDLGSSSTSLEKDGEDSGLKQWVGEESAELEWCYPSLLNTSLHEDIVCDGEREESRHGKMVGDEETAKDESGKRVGKIGMVSIIRTPPNHTDIKNSMTQYTPQCEEMPPRKKVALVGSDSAFPLSPFKQPIEHLSDPNQKPSRSSGLDCGDIDHFVQSDSFVYLAVSARPASQGEVTTVTEVSTHITKYESTQQHSVGVKTQLDKSSTGSDARPTHLVLQKSEERDFLCTDSFVYLAAPACLLLGPAGTTQYSGRESDSDSSGSGPVDESVLGCGSLAGDSDWDSDLSDCNPSRPSRIVAAGNKSAGVSRPKRQPAELGWDLFGETTEPEVLSELFMEQDSNNNGKAKKVSCMTTGMAATQAIPMETKPVTMPVKTTVEQPSTTMKVTWQFKPPQMSVCTGSRKDKDKEVTSASLVRLTTMGRGETNRPSSSSSSSSPSSSSSG